MTSNVNYGAVEDPSNPEAEFDEKNAYYLKEQTLTREQRLRKALLVAVPILAAILIVGGAALFLLRDFNSLYPGRHGGGGGNENSFDSSRIKHQSSTTTSSIPAEEPSGGPSPPRSAPSTHSDSSSTKSCRANGKCAELGLTGMCCPTGDGIMLGCCN